MDESWNNRMKTVNQFKKLMYVIFLPVGLLLFFLSSSAPALTEKVYSNGIFKIIGQVLSLITALLPFSLAEFTIIFLVLFILWNLIRIIIRMLKEKSRKWHIVLNFFINILAFASIIYFGFVILWGLNYNRLPFSSIANLDVRPTSVKELAEVCENIIGRANELRSKVSENKEGVMYLPNGVGDALKRAYKGYENAAKLYPELGGRYGRPKGVIFSKAMCYTGIEGVYFPFTAEANVNIAIPDSSIPSTTTHEMAHQRGFAREDEANYIAYLTCSMHPDVDFQYSGTLLALIHTMNTLYDYDREQYNRLRTKYSKGVIRDLSAIREFWKQYEGPVENVSSSINDAYLKANLQRDGIYSYGRMVDLLIAEYRTKVSRPQIQ